jgi:hypothetical protein
MSGYMPHARDNYYETNKITLEKPIIRVQLLREPSNLVENLTTIDSVSQQFDSNIAKLNEYETLSAEMNDRYRRLSSSITAITTHPEYNKVINISKQDNLAENMQHDNKLGVESNRNMMMLGSITLATLLIYLTVI